MFGQRFQHMSRNISVINALVGAILLLGLLALLHVLPRVAEAVLAVLSVLTGSSIGTLVALLVNPSFLSSFIFSCLCFVVGLMQLISAWDQHGVRWMQRRLLSAPGQQVPQGLRSAYTKQLMNTVVKDVFLVTIASSTTSFFSLLLGRLVTIGTHSWPTLLDAAMGAFATICPYACCVAMWMAYALRLVWQDSGLGLRLPLFGVLCAFTSGMYAFTSVASHVFGWSNYLWFVIVMALHPLHFAMLSFISTIAPLWLTNVLRRRTQWMEEVRVGALVASNGFFAVWSVLYGELFAETIVEGNGWLHVPAEPAGCIEWGEDTARGCLVVNALPLQGSSSLFTVTQWIALCVVALLPVVAWSRSYQALDRIAPMLKADWSNNGPSSATWQLRGHRLPRPIRRLIKAVRVAADVLWNHPAVEPVMEPMQDEDHIDFDDSINSIRIRAVRWLQQAVGNTLRGTVRAVAAVSGVLHALFDLRQVAVLHFSARFRPAVVNPVREELNFGNTMLSATRLRPRFIGNQWLGIRVPLPQLFWQRHVLFQVACNGFVVVDREVSDGHGRDPKFSMSVSTAFLQKMLRTAERFILPQSFRITTALRMCMLELDNSGVAKMVQHTQRNMAFINAVLNPDSARHLDLGAGQAADADADTDDEDGDSGLSRIQHELPWLHELIARATDLGFNLEGLRRTSLTDIRNMIRPYGARTLPTLTPQSAAAGDAYEVAQSEEQDRLDFDEGIRMLQANGGGLPIDDDAASIGSIDRPDDPMSGQPFVSGQMQTPPAPAAEMATPRRGLAGLIHLLVDRALSSSARFFQLVLAALAQVGFVSQQAIGRGGDSLLNWRERQNARLERSLHVQLRFDIISPTDDRSDLTYQVEQMLGRKALSLPVVDYSGGQWSGPLTSLDWIPQVTLFMDKERRGMIRTCLSVLDTQDSWIQQHLLRMGVLILGSERSALQQAALEAWRRRLIELEQAVCAAIHAWDRALQDVQEHALSCRFGMGRWSGGLAGDAWLGGAPGYHMRFTAEAMGRLRQPVAYVPLSQFQRPNTSGLSFLPPSRITSSFGHRWDTGSETTNLTSMNALQVLVYTFRLSVPLKAVQRAETALEAHIQGVRDFLDAHVAATPPKVTSTHTVPLQARNSMSTAASSAASTASNSVQTVPIRPVLSTTGVSEAVPAPHMAHRHHPGGGTAGTSRIDDDGESTGNLKIEVAPHTHPSSSGQGGVDGGPEADPAAMRAQLDALQHEAERVSARVDAGMSSLQSTAVLLERFVAPWLRSSTWQTACRVHRRSILITVETVARLVDLQFQYTQLGRLPSSMAEHACTPATHPMGSIVTTGVACLEPSFGSPTRGVTFQAGSRPAAGADDWHSWVADESSQGYVQWVEPHTQEPALPLHYVRTGIDRDLQVGGSSGDGGLQYTAFKGVAYVAVRAIGTMLTSNST